MKTLISFRLRKDLDLDLMDALDRVDSKKLPDLCRSGLRLMLGMKTTKAIQIIEQPIVPEINNHSDIKNATKQKGPLKSVGTSWKPPSKKL